jgi:hypothetical protein
MTFQEFKAAVKEIAHDGYHAVAVQVTESYRSGRDNPVNIEWRGYTPAHGWVFAATPEAVLAEMRGQTAANIEQIGEVA